MIYLCLVARVVAFKFIASWAPAADVLALSTSEIDLSKLAKGDIMTAKWRGKAIFVANRSQEQLDGAIDADKLELRDQEVRVINEIG